MAYLPPGFPFPAPPPPRWSLSRPPPSPWRPLLSPQSNDKSSSGGLVASLVIAFVASLLAFVIVCSLCQGYRNSRAATAAAVAAAAAARPRPRPPPRPRDEEIQIRSRASDARPRRASPTAGLPAFTYSRSVKHNVTSGGEEAAATCSVCLGAFHVGQTVRLLPVCLHLYHVECIDPWLAEHSTCPLCRSDTDLTMDVGRLPPV